MSSLLRAYYINGVVVRKYKTISDGKYRREKENNAISQ